MIANRFRARYASKADRPLILAHRGDSFRAPENTLEAARLGREAGADGWELDVHLTRDGVPVVIHDESLRRTTDVARRFEGDPRASSGFLVEQFTLEEIRTLDAGSWFVDPDGGPRSAVVFGSTGRIAEADRAHYASGRVRVPTLAESLGWTVGADWLVNVEIKPTAGDPGRLVDAVLAEIRSAGATSSSTASSFDPEIVARLVAEGPDVAVGALIAGPLPDRPGDWLRVLGVDAIHAPAAALSGSLGESPWGEVPILAYTVNDAGPSGIALRLARAGVSGLFTDDPASFACLSRINRS